MTISNITSSGHYNITVVSRNGVSVQAGQAAALETSNVVFFVDLPTVAPTSGEGKPLRKLGNMKRESASSFTRD